jgi:hypothetical protein
MSSVSGVDVSGPGHPRDEVEEAFRHYFMTGPVEENWIAWSKLFTDDARYWDHYWGTFTGPQEIQMFLEGTMSAAPGVYTAMVWYQIEGDRVTWKGLNRADNPEPGGPVIEFPSLQLLTYAGDGKWSSEEDWWIAFEMLRFGREYGAACAKHDPDHGSKLSRKDWGEWVDWARPHGDHVATPSWLGRNDVLPIHTVRQMDFGVRNPK